MKTATKKSVLVVDDDRANIIALTHILSQEYTVFAAKNGQDAIEIAKEHLPCVILLDIIMPEMDGYEVLALLKNTEETRTIPVIFITGLTGAENEEKGMALGAADYIAKPFSSDIVKLRVRNQMKILDQISIINQRLMQQALMTSISQCFLSNSDIDVLFTDTLRMIGEFMGIAQVLLYDFEKFEKDENTLTCRNEWINPELNFPTRIGSKLLLKEPMLSIIRGLLTRKSDLCLHSNVPAFKSAMRPYRTDFANYIIAPIFIRGKMRAALDFSREEDGQNWSESDINLAALVANILSGAYERHIMERQSSIVDSSPQFILYLSVDGEVIYVNPAASVLTGHTQAEIMMAGLDLIFGAETARTMKDIHIPNTLRKAASSFEVSMTCKDGAVRVLAFTSFAAENGNIGAIAQEVTDLRALESSLIKAKEQAEQGGRDKVEFLSRMIHEMLAPMNAIIGMANKAHISDHPAQKADCLEKIEKASRSLLWLIDGVLDVSSLEKSVLNPEYSEFSFKTMLSGVLKTVQPYMEKKRQTLSCSIDPLIPDALMGDERRLAQVIRNLLMNANTFTPERGAIQLDVCIFGEADGDPVVRVEVNDNGIGIPQEKQAAIFHAFEQVGGSVSREFEGSGLGLALSKYIIEMMGGEIWVESEPGKGAKFTFTFKVKNVHSEDAGHNAATEPDKKIAGKTALLVEDVAINREILKTMLEDIQLQVVCAENGLQAVELFEADPGKYDIILMDIDMPVMDGWEATRRIRALDAPDGARVKIVALTVKEQREDIEKSREVGMNDHLCKPLDFDELLHKLYQHLGR